MYILFVHYVLFLSSDHLEISIKHLFTSTDSCLLYLASACFLLLLFDFFSLTLAFVYLHLPSVCIHLRSFASISVLVPPVSCILI